MFWQYRPEYLSFEGPGYNLVALDGEPTARFRAVADTIGQIEGLKDHLPLTCPRAEVGIVYHPKSQELFTYNDQDDRFLADLRGVYRTLWTHGIPADIITPGMDWSGYRLLFLPNVALMDAQTRERIERTGRESPHTRLVAEGSFGLYSADGQSSYRPPEGFAAACGVRVVDFSRVTEYDVAQGRNVVETPYGPATITTECGYAVLEPLGETTALASIGADTVAVRTADGRFTWLGFTLSAGFGNVGDPGLVLGLTTEAGVQAPVVSEGGPVVPVVRRSRQGGWLVFLFNLAARPAQATLRPRWPTAEACDLLAQSALAVSDGAFAVSIEPWATAVIYCTEQE